jgi:hypothetical protein
MAVTKRRKGEQMRGLSAPMKIGGQVLDRCLPSTHLGEREREHQLAIVMVGGGERQLAQKSETRDV